MAYKTPGVYVEEIPPFQPLVAEVETAIPAFIGYTEKADKNGEDLTNKPTCILSLLEFHELFGNEFAITRVNVIVDKNNNYAVTSITPEKYFYMYESLQLFFNNGGGKCYIVSVADYTKDPKSGFSDLAKGITALASYDEPGMILLPDAQLLTSKNELYTLQQQVLSQCASLKDRTGVFDLYERDSNVSDAVTSFRDQIGINDLQYGAAYIPWIYSAIPKKVDFRIFSSSVKDGSDVNVDLAGIGSLALNNLVLAAKKAEKDITTIQAGIDTAKGAFYSLEDAHSTLSREVKNKTTYDKYIGFIDGLINELEKWVSPNLGDQLASDTASYFTEILVPVKADISVAKSVDTGKPELNKAAAAKISLSFSGAEKSLTDFMDSFQKAANTCSDMAQGLLYKQHTVIGEMVSQIKKEMSKVPPSGAIAGVYAKVDRTRGVWKAPANISLNSVLGPVEDIDDSTQENLNIDVNGGKSINAIRTFTGKGTLVWGARTLAGNDNEWRYVPVRRFFNMVEESVKKSTAWAVFEPNTAQLWSKVKGMINNYLILKWREGAISGSTPDEAFFVRVGLGETMTAQDILEGKLIIEIGMAAVRPAEFIILKIMHKLQGS